MIYQHPLAYLLGLEGVALLRAFCGAYDREFTEAGLSDIRTLLESADALGEGMYARPTYLASLGHRVIGVDSSPEMLAHARETVPEAELHEADLHDLPLADDSVDLVVCAIALCHVPDLGRALTELVRVLRPNGHLVISDSRGLIGEVGLPLVRVGPDDELGYMPIWSRLASDYLAAALPLGLLLRRCVEPRRPSPLVGDDGTDLDLGVPPADHVPGAPPSIWSLHALATEATNAAWEGKPAAIIWHFQLEDDG